MPDEPMDRPIRVAMITFATNHHTIRWSRGLVQQGFEVHVIGHEGAPMHDESASLGGGRRQEHSIPVVSAATEWWTAVAATKPDVVYMQWLFARPAMLLALDPAWPLVATVMGSDVRADVHADEPGMERAWRTALLLRADAVTAAAEPLARIVCSYHPSLEAKTEVLPFGVDTAQFRPPATPHQRRVGDTFVIGHFKSDAPIYGRLDLLRAVELLLATGLDVIVHLAGRREPDGPVAHYLRAHPHVAAAVVDHDLQDVDAIAGLYHGLDVYVMNSTKEAFGVAAAEALASGVPVVASDVGGVSTLVRPSDTGLLVPPSDPVALAAALADLAAHPEFARSCGARGRARVQAKFEWRDSLTQLAGLLRRTARHGRSKHV